MHDPEHAQVREAPGLRREKLHTARTDECGNFSYTAVRPIKSRTSLFVPGTFLASSPVAAPSLLFAADLLVC